MADSKQLKIKDNLGRLEVTLSESVQAECKALFWVIERNNSDDKVELKIGRYKKSALSPITEPIEDKLKSGVTLKKDELDKLIEFISENYQPLQDGAKNYIVLDDTLNSDYLDQIKKIFSNPDKEQLIDIISENDILPDQVLIGLEHNKKIESVRTFKEMLDSDHVEKTWQDWFQINSWVLGTDFVQILDKRRIDVSNISDFLMQAYDGFLDIVEIKRPKNTLQFWASATDHGNYVPSSDLIKAVTQTTNYIFQVEKQADSLDFSKRLNGVNVIKPRGILIFGRSNDWNNEQKEAYRMLNSSFHNITILTYDHVLERAERILKVFKNVPSISSVGELKDELPF